MILIPGTIQKAVKEKVEVVIVAPVWRAQPWYSMLLQYSIKEPLIIPNRVRDAQGKKPEWTKKTKIAAWTISGETWKQEEYQKKLQPSSETKLGAAPAKTMNMHGENGKAGVVRGKEIQFKQLYQY